MHSFLLEFISLCLRSWLDRLNFETFVFIWQWHARVSEKIFVHVFTLNAWHLVRKIKPKWCNTYQTSGSRYILCMYLYTGTISQYTCLLLSTQTQCPEDSLHSFHVYHAKNAWKAVDNWSVMNIKHTILAVRFVKPFGYVTTWPACLKRLSTPF